MKRLKRPYETINFGSKDATAINNSIYSNNFSAIVRNLQERKKINKVGADA